MSKPETLVDHAVGDRGCDELPDRVLAVVERHRRSLVELANSLLEAGRSEAEVVAILQKASEGFSSKLEAKTEGLQS